MIYTVTLNTAVDVVVSEKKYLFNGIEEAESVPAGKGINVSRALKSAGFKSTAVAIVGHNDLELFKSVEDSYISAILVEVDGPTRRNITLTECKDGLEHHNRAVGYLASEEEYEKIYNILLDNVCEGDWVIFSGSLPGGLPSDTYLKLIKLCKTKGAYTVLDSSGKPLLLGIQASPYVIKPNIEELSDLWGSPIESPSQTEECIRRITTAYDIPVIMATFGAGGALLYSFEDKKFVRKPALMPDRRALSTVGCGDCCVAGLVAGLIEHLPYDECLERAMKYACANMYTTVPGIFYPD